MNQRELPAQTAIEDWNEVEWPKVELNRWNPTQYRLFLSLASLISKSQSCHLYVNCPQIDKEPFVSKLSKSCSRQDVRHYPILDLIQSATIKNFRM